MENTNKTQHSCTIQSQIVRSFRNRSLEKSSVVLILFILLSACVDNFPKLSAEQGTKLSIDHADFANHYLVINPDGYPLIEDNKIPTKTEFLVEKTNAIQQILGKAGGTCENCPIHLLVFVHGGLNSYQIDFNRMVSLMKKDSLLDSHRSPYVPFFVNWDSGLNTVVDDLFWIRLGDRKRDLGPISFPFLLPARMIMSASNIPVRLAHTVISYKEYCDFAADVKPCGTSLDDYFSWGMFPFYVVTAPILDSFGSAAWYQMKRRANLATASRLTTLTDDHFLSKSKRLEYYDAEGAALTLIRALAKSIKQQKRHVEVTLVGHSMGAFVLNRMLSAAVNMECSGTQSHTAEADSTPCLPPNGDSPIKHIIYLAPASPISEFDNITQPFLVSHPNTNAWIFTLNRKDEAGEFSIPWQKLVPRGSLLTWIDNIFEPVSSAGERTLGQMANLEKYYGIDHNKYQLACPATGTFDNVEAILGFRLVQLTVNRNESSVAERVKVYQSLGYCGGQHEGPEKHGDFNKTRYLGQALCISDPKAFSGTDLCSPHPSKGKPSIREFEPAL